VSHLNVAYDSLATTLYCDTWLERQGSLIPSTRLASARIEVFDHDGVHVVTLTDADAIPVTGRAQSNGRYALKRTGTVLVDNRPYNANVTIVDDIGSITSLQAFSTVG